MLAPHGDRGGEVVLTPSTIRSPGVSQFTLYVLCTQHDWAIKRPSSYMISNEDMFPGFYLAAEVPAKAVLIVG